MGEKFRRILPKVSTSTSILDSFTCRKVTIAVNYLRSKLRKRYVTTACTDIGRKAPLDLFIASKQKAFLEFTVTCTKCIKFV